MSPKLPMLTGYRVLDITQFVAGPTCTRLLAEAGADVIKVELAPHGDRSRAQGIKARRQAGEPAASSQSTYFFQHNHSKRSLALAWKHPRSIAILKTLAARADVLVENFSPGVMARAGLAYEQLSAINPRLIMCSISVAGQTGPLSTQPGYDYIAAAYAGVTDQIGEADGAPAQLPLAIGDVSTGVAAAMAIGFALLHRERTGEGQHIDAAILDTYFHMHEVNVPRVALRGDRFTPKRNGSQHPDGGPTGHFRCCDGSYINITALAHQWGQLAAAIGQPELVDDPRFRDARARRDHNSEIVALIEGWLGAFDTRQAALEALERHRVPCAPVLTLNEAMAHPHLRQRGTVREVYDQQLGDFAIPGPPVKFSRWPARVGLRADLLGARNEAVLKELAGLSDPEIAALYDEGVLVRDAGSEAPLALSYRPVAPDDRDYCIEVHHRAMRSYVEPLWGWDEAAQDRLAWDALRETGARHEIVLIGDSPIGYLSYLETPAHLFLRQLYLHPAHQGHGHGSAILSRLIARGPSAKPMELSVLTTNPRARAFYMRHGFEAVTETRERVSMRRVSAP